MIESQSLSLSNFEPFFTQFIVPIIAKQSKRNKIETIIVNSIVKLNPKINGPDSYIEATIPTVNTVNTTELVKITSNTIHILWSCFI